MVGTGIITGQELVHHRQGEETLVLDIILRHRKSPMWGQITHKDRKAETHQDREEILMLVPIGVEILLRVQGAEVHKGLIHLSHEEGDKKNRAICSVFFV